MTLLITTFARSADDSAPVMERQPRCADRDVPPRTVASSMDGIMHSSFRSPFLSFDALNRHMADVPTWAMSWPVAVERRDDVRRVAVVAPTLAMLDPTKFFSWFSVTKSSTSQCSSFRSTSRLTVATALPRKPRPGSSSPPTPSCPCTCCRTESRPPRVPERGRSRCGW